MDSTLRRLRWGIALPIAPCYTNTITIIMSGATQTSNTPHDDMTHVTPRSSHSFGIQLNTCCPFSLQRLLILKYFDQLQFTIHKFANATAFDAKKWNSFMK